MYLIPILSIAVQVGLIVHVIKTGRNMLWIWALALLPLVGAIAYVAVELLPELMGGRTARRAKSGMQRMIDPDRALRRASVTGGWASSGASATAATTIPAPTVTLLKRSITIKLPVLRQS